jgi:hypothetical protein
LHPVMGVGGMTEQRSRRFPPPWKVEQIPGGYKLIDANGQSLAYIYGRETKADADIAKVLTQTAKLGAPRIDGRDEVGGRDAPALYFGAIKMNNNFSVVDAVAEEGGRGTAATLFVKSGDDYIRVTTNVSMRTGGRGLGTVLTGAPLESIKAGKAYYGKTSVLGTPYVSGYEPIKDASGATIGVYFVGCTKAD